MRIADFAISLLAITVAVWFVNTLSGFRQTWCGGRLVIGAALGMLLFAGTVALISFMGTLIGLDL
jgi:hypothetical protein